MRFSPSALSVFRECPKCWWIEKNQEVKRPRGIFPSLPGGMDRVLKVYVDSHLAVGKLPPEATDIPGARPYQNRGRVDQWRNWRTAPMVEIGTNDGKTATLSGAVDDVLEFEDGSFSPWDFKTRGAPPKDGDSEIYYGPQMDAYHLTLQEGAGMKMNGRAYLTYYWPGEVRPGGMVQFNTQTVILRTDPQRARQLVIEAAECLTLKTPPNHSVRCEYCSYSRDRVGALAMYDNAILGQPEKEPIAAGPATTKSKKKR